MSSRISERVENITTWSIELPTHMNTKTVGNPSRYSLYRVYDDGGALVGFTFERVGGLFFDAEALRDMLRALKGELEPKRVTVERTEGGQVTVQEVTPEVETDPVPDEPA